MLKRMAVAALASALAFLLVTWWALESGGVAVLSTRAPDGSARSTHVWYVETAEGELWLEAGTPENPWYLDIQRDPQLEFRSEGLSRRLRAQPRPGRAEHERIRSQLRAKYGLRDRWVGMLVDTSRSVAVQLVPRTAGDPP